MILCFPIKEEAEKKDDPEERTQNDGDDGEEEQFKTQGRDLHRNLLFVRLPNVTDQNSHGNVLQEEEEVCEVEELGVDQEDVDTDVREEKRQFQGDAD